MLLEYKNDRRDQRKLSAAAYVAVLGQKMSASHSDR
jgi:hypothetical protein